MTLPALDADQADALAAVAALYLSETRWALGVGDWFPPRAREEILRRRAVCTLITGGTG